MSKLRVGSEDRSAMEEEQLEAQLHTLKQLFG